MQLQRVFSTKMASNIECDLKFEGTRRDSKMDWDDV